MQTLLGGSIHDSNHSHCRNRPCRISPVGDRNVRSNEREGQAATPSSRRACPSTVGPSRVWNPCRSFYQATLILLQGRDSNSHTIKGVKLTA